MRKFLLFIYIIAVWLLSTAWAVAQSDSLLTRMWAWPDSVYLKGGPDGGPVLPTDTFQTNVYQCYHIRVDRRNVTMMTVPNMFDIARDKDREFYGESYLTLRYTAQKDVESFRHLNLSNVPRRRKILTHARHYMTLRLYETTLVGDHLLSPFHASNRHFYRYEVKKVGEWSVVSFEPRLLNTQLVSGLATVDSRTGRVLGARIEGEYDMVRFVIRMTMGTRGINTLLPERCEANITLRFLGNKITAEFVSLCNQPVSLPLSITNSDSVGLMDEVRPRDRVGLSWSRNGVVPKGVTQVADSVVEEDVALTSDEAEKETVVEVSELEPQKAAGKPFGESLWEAIQDNVLNPIRTDFGGTSGHSFRLGPIFNPFYFGYSKSRGLTYRLRMDFQYHLGSNSRLLWDLRSGYAFKQRQLYFNMPLTWEFNRKRKGYVQVELANGKRISTSDVLDYVKAMHRNDTINFDRLDLSYFKDMWLRTVVNHALSRHVSGQVGFIYHRRSAVSPASFSKVNMQRVYYSFAPLLSLSWKPSSSANSPVFTVDYEQGLRGVLNSNMGYSRWEFDGQYIMPLPCTRSLSLRGGVGFYLSKAGERYFLDYTNFRKNNLPGGWNDDYSGEFELLHSDWYNASDYYVRVNCTYESPMFLLSRLPWAGRIVERERIYFSTLAVRNYFPYIECGYGLTNRIFSIGTFFGFSSHGYEGFGVRFGFELFSDW